MIGPGALQDALGIAARLRDDAVGVGRRLVLQALLVGAGGLHIAEGVDHLGRRVDLLQLHLVDADAGAVVVEHVLHQLLHGLLGLLARLRQERLDVGLADDLAHGALGHFLHGDLGVLDVEEVFLRVLDAPEDDEIDIDDVLVAGQHQAFLRHVGHAADSRAPPGPRMPISMMFCRVTFGRRTSSIG